MTPTAKEVRAVADYIERWMTDAGICLSRNDCLTTIAGLRAAADSGAMDEASILTVIGERIGAALDHRVGGDRGS